MLWRAAFLARICQINIPFDMEVYELDQKIIDDISIDPYSEALAHLLILFGAGYVDAEMVSTLAHSAEQYSEIIEQTENFAIEQCKEAEENQVDEKFVRNALMCVINSQMYENMQEVDFDTARKLCKDTYAVIHKGFLHITSRDFLTLYIETGEPMGRFDDDGKIKVLKSEEIINDLKDEKRELDEVIAEAEAKNVRSDLAFCLNLKNFLYIKELYGKPYFVEFIKYAKSEGIPFDGSLTEKYEDYVRRNKMQFVVSAIQKKRNVCGELVNWFDYCNASMAGKNLELSDEYDITLNIDLTSKYSKEENPSVEALARRAAEEFLNKVAFLENSVIEVSHKDNRTVFHYTGKELAELDKETFRRVPFDYNYIWSLITEWSRRRIIRKNKESITIPPEEWEKIEPKDREYTKRLIEEQYFLKRRKNKMLQKLSELSTQAEDEVNEANGIKAQQEALKADRAESIQEE